MRASELFLRLFEAPLLCRQVKGCTKTKILFTQLHQYKVEEKVCKGFPLHLKSDTFFRSSGMVVGWWQGWDGWVGVLVLTGSSRCESGEVEQELRERNGDKNLSPSPSPHTHIRAKSRCGKALEFNNKSISYQLTSGV